MEINKLYIQRDVIESGNPMSSGSFWTNNGEMDYNHTLCEWRDRDAMICTPVWYLENIKHEEVMHDRLDFAKWVCGDGFRRDYFKEIYTDYANRQKPKDPNKHIHKYARTNEKDHNGTPVWVCHCGSKVSSM
jgi:hypothetical protein